MTQEESRLMTEHRRRQEMRETMEAIAELWCKFAEAYHGSEFVDAEHAFGVIVREYHEAIEEGQAARTMIKQFEDICLRTHCYDEAGKIMKELYEHSVSAAEEFAQLAAVARKAAGSGFAEVSG